MPLKLHNINVIGSGHRTAIMAHGFGCDQNMWRFLTPILEHDYRIILFDYTGSGKSDASQFKIEKYSSLNGYAQDLIDVCTNLNLRDALFIGHSVSAMIGLIASLKVPELFDKLVMICPSPCFLNLEPDYFGGFDRADLEELLAMMDKNYIGWANHLSPLVMGTDNPAELSVELSGSFCSTDPDHRPDVRPRDLFFGLSQSAVEVKTSNPDPAKSRRCFGRLVDRRICPFSDDRQSARCDYRYRTLPTHDPSRRGCGPDPRVRPQPPR